MIRKVGGVEVELPDGMTEAQIEAALAKLPASMRMPQEVNQPVSSHERAQPVGQQLTQRGVGPGAWASHRESAPRDYAQFGPASQLMRDAYEPTKAKAAFAEASPDIASSVATMLAPESLVYRVPAAAGAGFAASKGRGDDTKTAAWEGGKQAAMEALPLVARPVAKTAKWLMNFNVPPSIARDFSEVDIPGEMLKYGARPGSKESAKKIVELSQTANAARHEAAKQVPSINAVQAISDFRGPYQEAVSARAWTRAERIMEEAKKAIADIRDPRAARAPGAPPGSHQGNLPGSSQMTRKTLKANEGAAAVDDPFSKDLIPDLRAAEAAALTRNIRTVPGAAEALDKSQALMAIDKVMKNKAYTNVGNAPPTRMGNFTTGVLTSPLGTSTAAHGINQLSKAIDPRVARALHMLMNQRSGQTPPPEDEEP